MGLKPSHYHKFQVSVIIINYNTFDLTCSCISSIYANTRTTSIEIILVDNNSVECDPELFKLRFPKLKLIKSDKNLGFGAANNMAMNFASGKYFLLINSDTYLLNDAIDRAFEFAENYSHRAQIFGAKVLNTNLTVQRSFFAKSAIGYFHTIKTSFFDTNPAFYKISRRKEKLPSIEKEVGGLYGSYIFLDRIVFEETGGFDPDFFMYCEDTEWFRNRIYKKFKILICDSAIIVHIGGGSSKKSIVSAMNILSYYLYWYKLGYLHFLIFVLGTYLNLPITFLLSLMMTKAERKRHIKILKIKIKILPKVLIDIPRYKNGFGSRNSPLIY